MEKLDFIFWNMIGVKSYKRRCDTIYPTRYIDMNFIIHEAGASLKATQ
jgi:hypothetical protein